MQDRAALNSCDVVSHETDDKELLARMDCVPLPTATTKQNQSTSKPQSALWSPSTSGAQCTKKKLQAVQAALGFRPCRLGNDGIRWRSVPTPVFDVTRLPPTTAPRQFHFPVVRVIVGAVSNKNEAMTRFVPHIAVSTRVLSMKHFHLKLIISFVRFSEV